MQIKKLLIDTQYIVDTESLILFVLLHNADRIYSPTRRYIKSIKTVFQNLLDQYFVAIYIFH